MRDYINNQHRYYSLDYYLKKRFKTKVFKVALNGNFTCPNRDGTISNKGCIFCSPAGSGDFAGNRHDSLAKQFNEVKTIIHHKWPNASYIVYFQANTNTYAPLEKLKKIYEEAISLDQNIVAISIATRPDCLSKEIVEYLGELNQRLPVWVELGLQTIDEQVATFINRGYQLDVFTEAVTNLHQQGIEVIVHIINGLPNETKEMMLNTIRFLNSQKIQGIKIIGDMPIYVAYDSSDVWANPKYWQLDKNLVPKVVAGVPPDYFARTGQLWGNPIYNYQLMKKDGYTWWIKRIEESFKIYDVVRIDHFRGFESYYAIKYTDKTAEFGKWIKGPGNSLFKKIKQSLGELEIIAEDLGFLTPEVYQLLEDTGYPGMKILQFGFDPNADSEYLPHNYSPNSIAYTGTHDNKTLKDWLASITEEEKEFCFAYANINNEEEAVNKLIKCVLASPSETVIIPLVDYLELGEEARFNIPSTLGNNWVWRMDESDLTEELQERILKNTKTYKR
jgi:radical SAM protein (TIGR01212 family)